MKKKGLDKSVWLAVAAGSLAVSASVQAEEMTEEEMLQCGDLGKGSEVRSSLMELNDQQNEEDYLAFWWLWDDDEADAEQDGSRAMPKPMQSNRIQGKQRKPTAGADDEGSCGDGMCGDGGHSHDDRGQKNEPSEGSCGDGMCGDGSCGDQSSQKDSSDQGTDSNRSQGEDKGEGACGDGQCGDGSCGDIDSDDDENSKPWWEQ